MSIKSRKRKDTRIITIAAEGEPPQELRIDQAHPVVVYSAAIPGTPEADIARGLLEAAFSHIENLTEREQYRVLKPYGFYDDIVIKTTEREIGFSGLDLSPLFD